MKLTEGTAKPASQPTDIIRQNTYTMDIKHKVLVIPTCNNSYIDQPFDQLRNQGFLVQVTSLEYFTLHVKDLIKEFDILVMNQGYEVRDRVWWLNHLSKISAQQAADALLLWKNSGKKFIYTFLNNYGKAEVRKYDIDGNIAESVDLSPELFTTDIITSYIPGGEGIFEVTEDCPLSKEELLDMPFVEFKSYNIYPIWRSKLKPTEKVLLENVYNDIHDVYAYWKPGEYVCAVYGGYISGKYLETPAYKYINVGSLARLLIGDNSPIRLALDCIYSRKVASLGYDCDATNKPEAIEALTEAHGGKIPLELGLVTNYLNEELVNRYRNLNSYIKWCSHSKYHFQSTGYTYVSNETHVIPESRVIQLKYPYRVQSLVVTIGSTTLSSKNFIEAVSDTQYGYDELKGLLKFSANNVGNTVTISYRYLKETEEWIVSLKELEEYGLLTDDVIYLTGAEYGMHGTTHALLNNRNVTLCNYSLPNQYAWACVNQGYIPIMSPYLSDDTTGGFKALYALITEGYSKDEIENGKVDESINNANSRYHPFMWYDHDFLYSDTENGIHNNSAVHSSWKGSTYAETRQKLIDGLKWFFNRLDQENVYWMPRSAYHRRYKLFNENFIYNVESDGNKHYVYMQNRGKEMLPGVTFRSSKKIISARLLPLPSPELPVTMYAGDDLVSLDVMSGERLVLEIITE